MTERIHGNAPDRGAGQAGTRPRVSVVIPTYDRPDCLKESVASAFAQTYTNVEVIIATDPRGTGTFAAMERGLKLATGDWVCFFSDDDRMHTNFVERCMEESEDADVLYADYNEWHHDDGSLVAKSDVMNFNAMIFRRSMLAALMSSRGHLFDPDLSHRGADTVLIQELRRLGARFRRVATVLMDYRVHQGQASATYTLRNILQIQHTFHLLRIPAPEAFPNRFVHLLWMMKSNLHHHRVSRSVVEAVESLLGRRGGA